MNDCMVHIIIIVPLQVSISAYHVLRSYCFKQLAEIVRGDDVLMEAAEQASAVGKDQVGKDDGDDGGRTSVPKGDVPCTSTEGMEEGDKEDHRGASASVADEEDVDDLPLASLAEIRRQSKEVPNKRGKRIPKKNQVVRYTVEEEKMLDHLRKCPSEEEE